MYNFDDIINSIINKLKKDMYVVDEGEEIKVSMPATLLVEMLIRSMNMVYNENIKKKDFKEEAKKMVNEYFNIEDYLFKRKLEEGIIDIENNED